MRCPALCFSCLTHGLRVLQAAQADDGPRSGPHPHQATQGKCGTPRPPICSQLQSFMWSTVPQARTSEPSYAAPPLLLSCVSAGRSKVPHPCPPHNASPTGWDTHRPTSAPQIPASATNGPSLIPCGPPPSRLPAPGACRAFLRPARYAPHLHRSKQEPAQRSTSREPQVPR
jgi:hypothetical protein